MDRRDENNIDLRCSIFDCRKGGTQAFTIVSKTDSSRSIIQGNKSFAFHHGLKFDSHRFFCTRFALFARLPWQTQLLNTASPYKIYRAKVPYKCR